MRFFKKKKDRTGNRKELKVKSYNQLEELLKEASNESGVKPQFQETLLQSELIILTEGNSRQEGNNTLNEGDRLEIISFKDNKIPVFTSTDRIFDNDVIKSQIHFTGLNAKDLFKIIRGASIVLNPFSDFSREFSPSEIESLLNKTPINGLNKQEIKQKTVVRIGEPAQIPNGLENSLIEFAKIRNDINAIYVAMIERINSEEYPSLLIGVKVQDNEQLIFGELGELVQPYVLEKQRIEMKAIKNNGGIDGYFETIEPIYKK